IRRPQAKLTIQDRVALTTMKSRRFKAVASSADAQVAGRNDLSLAPEQRGHSATVDSGPTSRCALADADPDITFPSFMDDFTRSGGAGWKTAVRPDPLLG